MTLEDIKARFDLDTSLISWNEDKLDKLQENQQRYATWKQYAEQRQLYPTEFLLPRILCHCPEDYPQFMSKGRSRQEISDEKLQQALTNLGPWSFHFKLREKLFTNDNPVGKNRLLCRSHLITSTVEKLLGSALAESTFLDMGCHSGFFSFDIASRGALGVTGIELRESNVAQANFLSDFYQVPNVQFQVEDVMAYQAKQPFSVVYNLGLLYHVTCPIELMRKTYDLCSHLAVVDTVCHKEPISAYITAFDKDTANDAEGKTSSELHPTYRALIDTMHHAGFKQLVELVPHSGRVAGIYKNQTRRCIIGFK